MVAAMPRPFLRRARIRHIHMRKGYEYHKEYLKDLVQSIVHDRDGLGNEMLYLRFLISPAMKALSYEREFVAQV